MQRRWARQTEALCFFCRLSFLVSRRTHRPHLSALESTAYGAQADHLRAICPGIELVKADLLSDDGWATAVQGTKFVVHMASPFVFSALLAVLNARS